MKRAGITFSRTARSAARGLAAGAVCLAMWACAAEEVDIPDLQGPSEQAESLVLTATPDLLVADGASTSIVQAIFRDKNGQPIRGRAINFVTADEAGRLAAIGTLSSDFGKGHVVTNSDGIATVVYTSPYRTDATANQTVLIKARAVGNDANGINLGQDPTFWYHQVRIELRSAEPRMFPQNPSNTLPTCQFVAEFPNGFRVPAAGLFQNTSFDADGTIVRYEWRFSDDPSGRVEYSPDTGHIFRTPGSWTVSLTVTDDDGGQDICTAAVRVTS